MTMTLKFDWVNPDDLTNDLAAEKLEKYMEECLLLDPQTETPVFDKKRNKVLCKGFEFQLPSAFRKFM